MAEESINFPESAHLAGQIGGAFVLPVDMIVLACGRCGVMFAMPRALHLAALGGADGASRAVYCPAGHANTRSSADSEGPASPVQTALEMTGRLAEAEARLAAQIAGQGHGTGGGAAMPDAAELVRRARFVAARAMPGAHKNGRFVCTVCGHEKKGHEGIVSHLLRAHVAELVEFTGV